MREKFIDRLRKRVLLCDGGTGILIQTEERDVDKDAFGGLKLMNSIMDAKNGQC